MLEYEFPTDTSVRVKSSESFGMHASCPKKPYGKTALMAKASGK
jgi:hypothetical protein